MALTTIRFETLLERNTRALENAGSSPDVTREEIIQLESRARDRVKRLLHARSEIEELASTDNQREAYGAEEWQRNFIRLHDYRSDESMDIDDNILREKIWRAVPNSRFKRFQELFSHSDQFIIPRFDIDDKGTIKFPSSVDFNAMSLAPCLISPDRISDDFAQDLRLCEFVKTDKPVDRLRKKHEAIPRLKKIWESTVPLQQNHHRLLAVQASTNETEQRYPSVEGADPDVIGSILYTREGENATDNKNAFAQRSVQFFGSAYAAYRKTLHEQHIYDQELDELIHMQVDLQSLNGELNAQWKDPSRQDVLRDRCIILCRQCIEALEECVNKYKIDAVYILRETQTLRDSLGRENISATMSRMVAVTNRFSKRYAEMKPKAGFNQQDRMTLQQHIRTQETILETFRRSVVSSAPVLEKNKTVLFTQVQLSPDSIKTQTTSLLKHMEINPAPLKQLTLLPFRFYGEGLHESYKDLQTALMGGDRDWAVEMVIKMHLLGKFQAVRKWFEKLKSDLLDTDHLSVARIRIFVSELHKLFSTFQVFPQKIIDDYQEPFEELKQGLENLQQLLAPYEHQDLDIDERSQLFRELKNYLDDFDIEDRTKALL